MERRMRMKNYENAELEVIKFETEDIVTSSGRAPIETEEDVFG
jgi:hypothetical protein